MDFPLQNKVVGSGKLPGYRIRKWGLVEESHHGMRNRRMKSERYNVWQKLYIMSLFFAKGCRRSRRWQILCIYTDNELKAVLVRGPGD